MKLIENGQSRIKGILFDSGDTLVRPKGGSWWPKEQYVSAFAAHGVNDANLDRFDDAVSKGRQYLDDNHHLTTELGLSKMNTNPEE